MKIGYDYVGISTPFYCHDGDGNILMHKRSVQCRDEQGKWDIGGGGIEFGDKVEDALRKDPKNILFLLKEYAKYSVVFVQTYTKKYIN